jgi:dolichol kinase
VFNFIFIELENLTMQYWATSTSSLGVLVFLCLVISRSSDTTRYSSSVMDAKFSLIGIVLYAAVCCVSIATTSHTGEFVILHSFLLSHNFLWCLAVIKIGR